MYPFIQITSSIYLPSFFLVISGAVSLSLFIFAKSILNKNLDYKFHINLSLVLVLSGFVGGRLAHVLIEHPNYYFINPEKIFYIWEGGYIFFGGLIAAAASGLFYFRLKEKSWKSLNTTLDSIAPATALAYSLGRIGCFLAGCCYGKLTDLPWAIQQRHPTQLYAAFWELGVFFILTGLEKGKSTTSGPHLPAIHLAEGSLFWIWIGLHGFGRFWIELLRDDFRGPDFIFSISGWVSIVLIFTALFQIAKILHCFKKNIKP